MRFMDGKQGGGDLALAAGERGGSRGLAVANVTVPLSLPKWPSRRIRSINGRLGRGQVGGLNPNGEFSENASVIRKLRYWMGA